MPGLFEARPPEVEALVGAAAVHIAAAERTAAAPGEREAAAERIAAPNTAGAVVVVVEEAAAVGTVAGLATRARAVAGRRIPAGAAAMAPAAIPA